MMHLHGCVLECRLSLPQILILVLALTSAPSSWSETLDVNGSYPALGQHVEMLQEQGEPYTLEQALAAYDKGMFTPSAMQVIRLPHGSRPHWFTVTLDNSGTQAVQRRLLITNALLDSLLVVHLHNGKLSRQFEGGDYVPYRERPIPHHWFVYDLSLEPGLNQLFIRIASDDPIVMPLYLVPRETAHDKDMFTGYSYGLLYGVIIALLIYNTMIYLSIRRIQYLLYVLYLASFFVMNLFYTGHLFALLQPESTVNTRWLQPFLVFVYASTGSAFTLSFLETRVMFPRLFRAIITVILAAFFLFLAGILANSAGIIHHVVLNYTLLFSVTMLGLGIATLLKGLRSARYFILASLATLTGTIVTVLAVQGLIPFSELSFRAIEIGIAIDMLLLSLALADQLRISQQEKIEAEHMARYDHLTKLYNRRAFIEYAYPLWRTALRYQRPLSLIMMDIDHFKGINDAYGHTMGDRVLETLSDAIRHIARSNDIAARWGGEEFVILLPETDMVQAEKMAERLREFIQSSEIDLEEHKLNITASFGVSTLTTGIQSIDTLITKADSALYQAKQEGRNRTVCMPLTLGKTIR